MVEFKSLNTHYVFSRPEIVVSEEITTKITPSFVPDASCMMTALEKHLHQLVLYRRLQDWDTLRLLSSVRGWTDPPGLENCACPDLP